MQDERTKGLKYSEESGSCLVDTTIGILWLLLYGSVWIYSSILRLDPTMFFLQSVLEELSKSFICWGICLRPSSARELMYLTRFFNVFLFQPAYFFSQKAPGEFVWKLCHSFNLLYVHSSLALSHILERLDVDAKELIVVNSSERATFSFESTATSKLLFIVRYCMSIQPCWWFCRRRFW